uniref:S1 motif domain-containing protein n=1 Tax=Callorhinchus milii TaxID=7868 RepID=A0A4W3GVR3_CALMI
MGSLWNQARMGVIGSRSWCMRGHGCRVLGDLQPVEGGVQEADKQGVTMANLEADFPRGGAQRKPSQTKGSAKEEDLFRLQQELKKKKPKKKVSRPDKEKKPKKAVCGWSQTGPRKLAELLSFRRLTPGWLMLGCVKEVTDYELVMALPHGLTGYVGVANISDAYSQHLREQVEEELPQV